MVGFFVGSAEGALVSAAYKDERRMIEANIFIVN